MFLTYVKILLPHLHLLCLRVKNPLRNEKLIRMLYDRIQQYVWNPVKQTKYMNT